MQTTMSLCALRTLQKGSKPLMLEGALKQLFSLSHPCTGAQSHLIFVRNESQVHTPPKINPLEEVSDKIKSSDLKSSPAKSFVSQTLTKEQFNKANESLKAANLKASAEAAKVSSSSADDKNQSPGQSFPDDKEIIKETFEHVPGDIDKTIEETLIKLRAGKFDHLTDPEDLKHFRAKSQPQRAVDFTDPEQALQRNEPPIGVNVLPHPIWSHEEVHGVKTTHKTPERIVDHLAYMSVQALRKSFDYFSGFNTKVRDDKMWINRICFLETVAGVPGMVAGMMRHLHSLRRMRRDHGWIHTLLEEAENERMHLMTALQLKQPGFLFRMAVLGTQGVFVSFWSVAYMLSPRYCHRFVGYLEEEAVITYTKCLQDIENGAMQPWKTLAAPDVASRYWHLAPDATMKDVILAIRADEAHHRVVNHTLGSMREDDYNPYRPGH